MYNPYKEFEHSMQAARGKSDIKDGIKVIGTALLLVAIVFAISFFVGIACAYYFR